jgi:hypothetical protein
VNRLARQGPNLLVDGSPIAIVWDDRPRPWFECPLCKRRCRHVYLHRTIACRICSGPLDYTSPISMPITAIAQSNLRHGVRLCLQCPMAAERNGNLARLLALASDSVIMASANSPLRARNSRAQPGVTGEKCREAPLKKFQNVAEFTRPLHPTAVSTATGVMGLGKTTHSTLSRFDVGGRTRGSTAEAKSGSPRLGSIRLFPATTECASTRN